ncbi:MAG: hypothetical protein QNJ71_06600 [Acidimicrobiia bacterium]|nr:hypothetical protein [Acidimicrobiia bacterium]
MEPWQSLLIVLAVIAVAWWFLKKVVKLGVFILVAVALLGLWWWLAIGRAEALLA